MAAPTRATDLVERELRLRGPFVPAALSAAAVAATASASGGYFPPAWGWSALALFLGAAAALVVVERVELGRTELVALASLASLVSLAGLSALWSQSPPRSILEAQRGLVYVGALGAFLLLCSRRAAPALVAGTLAAASGLSLWGLATKLFPDHFGLDRVALGQLARPLGYWNAVGITAVLAALLAIGVAAGDSRRAARAGVAALVPPLVATLYLTFSRGSWLALGLGLAVLVALHPAKARATVTGLALAGPSVIGVWLASRSYALTRAGTPLADATHAGHRIALALALLAAAAAVASAFADRVPVPRAPSWLKPALVVLLVVATVLAIREGGVLLGHAYDAFRSPTVSTGSDLNSRLFSASGNARADYWRVAWHDVEAHPVAGSGAGTFELRWYRERPNAFGARDAHNLYLETLAELGPAGVVLLLIALGAPLVALRRGRSGVEAAAAAAYCAYLGHAALDWDWEVPTVTLAALACGSALLVGARTTNRPARLPTFERAAGIAIATTLAAVAGIGYVQETALSKAQRALDAGALDEAASQARRAERLAPWQADPWTTLGQVQLAQNDRRQARSSFRRALAEDTSDWYPWYQLALASRGQERAGALAEALRRNPRAPELAQLRG